MPVEKPIKQQEPPHRSGAGTNWFGLLQPLTQRANRGKWWLLKEYNTAAQAWDAQGNLTKREVRIPHPDHDWEFASRKGDLFGIYRGPKQGKKLNRKAKGRR